MTQFRDSSVIIRIRAKSNFGSLLLWHHLRSAQAKVLSIRRRSEGKNSHVNHRRLSLNLFVDFSLNFIIEWIKTKTYWLSKWNKSWRNVRQQSDRKFK